MIKISRILGEVLSGIANEVESAAKSAVSPLAPYLRRLATGVVVAVCSAFMFAAGLLFAAASLFLEIAHYRDLSVAAIWTSGAAFLTALIILGLGFSLLKKPRP